MEFFIQISKINDFLYCPKSLYLHCMYEDFSEALFHNEPQIKGKINHKVIDKKIYSTAKRFLIGANVYSQKYRICGKIDIYDKETQTLIERKTKIKKIYEGYKYQLCAQYFCLTEMGYFVKKLILRSLQDNKNYEISIPTQKKIIEFEKIIQKILSFNPQELLNHHCPKCDKSFMDP